MHKLAVYLDKYGNYSNMVGSKMYYDTSGESDRRRAGKMDEPFFYKPDNLCSTPRSHYGDSQLLKVVL